MKVKHLALIWVVLALLSASSCKKDNGDDGETAKNELAKKIQWKWQVESLQVNNHFGGVDHIDEIEGTPSDYVDFRTDGKMYTSFQGNLDTSDYIIENDTRLVIDGDKANIKRLTDNAFVIFTRDETGSIGYVELQYNLKK